MPPCRQRPGSIIAGSTFRVSGSVMRRRTVSRTSERYGASSSFLHFLTMAFSAFTPLASASGSSSARAMGRILGIACERIETRSRLVPSKKRSKSFAPVARSAASPSPSSEFTSSAKSRLSPPCSTRSITRAAEATAASWIASSWSGSLATRIMTGSTSERWRWTVCGSGTTASDARPRICRTVHSSRSPESSLSTTGSTAPACFDMSFSRPLRKSSPCSSTSSSSSCCSTHLTMSPVAFGPTALCRSATTSQALFRTLSVSSMMACRMAGMSSPA
mmetsp:Transcript_1/g.10  ORF Transcript_1/g.10 Transcript_1/m.10 type:complete len:276 (+) Transcript_1:696-1523(+)